MANINTSMPIVMNDSAQLMRTIQKNNLDVCVCMCISLRQAVNRKAVRICCKSIT